MNKFIKVLALSSTFALAGCNEQNQKWADEVTPTQTALSTPFGMYTLINLDARHDKSMDIDGMVNETCKRLYTSLNTKDDQRCTVNIRDTRNSSKEEHGHVQAECKTSPWYFQPKYCQVTKPYKPS